MNPDVIYVRPFPDYCLRLEFENGEVRIYDAKPLLDFGIFDELRETDYFQKAFVESGSVEWPRGQGLSFNTLYLESEPVQIGV